MNSQGKRRTRKPGWLLVGVSLLCHPAVVSLLVSPDRHVTNPTFRGACYAIALGWFLAGALIVIRPDLWRAPAVRKAMARLLLLGCGTTLALAACEIFIRVYDPHPFKRPELERLFRYDETLGWEFIPGRTARTAAPYQFVQEVAINTHGMRDGACTVQKSAGVRRIAVLGDSFVAGLEVEPEEVFSERLEQMLGPSWEVLNFGVSGYGPLQEVLLLEEKVLAFGPDVVWLVVYIRNDFDDVLGLYDSSLHYARPRGSLNEQGELVVTDIPVPRLAPVREEKEPWTLLKPTDFHLYNFLRLRHAVKHSVLVNAYPEVRLFRKEVSAERASEITLMKAVLARAAQLTASAGGRFGLVIAPTILQVYEKTYWDKVLTDKNLSAEDYDIHLPNQQLRRMAEDVGIPVMDLTPGLRKSIHDGDDLYFLWNQHWTSHGHAVVAGELRPFLGTMVEAP